MKEGTPGRARRTSLRLYRRAAAAAHVVPFASDDLHLKRWTTDGWRQYEARQQPEYPDLSEVAKAVAEIGGMPPLVFAGNFK